MASITQSQLAKKLGLSRSTVAAALNPNSSVQLKPATRKRVLEEASRLGYRPHRFAQSLRAGRSGTIGVFHFGGLSQVAAERLWHACRSIQAAGYQTLVSDASWAPEGTHAACEAMIDARVEGVIVAGLNDPASVSEMKLLQNARIPIVTLSGNELPRTPHLRGDAADAVHRLTHHLARLGRRRILLLMSHTHDIQAGAYTWASIERLNGFKLALRELSGKIVPQFSPQARQIQGCVLAVNIPTDRFNPFHPGREAMRRVFSQELLPDAVICENDEWAIGALAACREQNIRVPHDMAITGYDNNAIGAYCEVPLTTVAQPSQLMAEKAVGILLEMIKKQTPPRTASLLKFPCRIIIRESCGAHLAQK